MQEYKDFAKAAEDLPNFGCTFREITSNFTFFFKKYLINPLTVCRTMKKRDNLNFALFVGFIHIISSVLLFLGFCLNCGFLLKQLYSGAIYIPVLQSILFGILFTVLTCACFFAMTYIVSLSKDTSKPRATETLSVFCTNTIGLSCFYIVCFAMSFLSFYLSLLIFLFAFFYFGIICTIGIEALTETMIFGKQTFATSYIVSAMLACLLFVFVAFLYATYSFFTVDGAYITDIFYIIIRYLK